MTDHNDTITREKFMAELWRYKRGSVTRRHFLGVTGLGTATAVLGAAMPGLMPRPAWSQANIGDRVILATWPNYHEPTNFEAFTEATGAAVQVNVFGSNEEMLAKLQAGGSGWDVFVPTNYTITTYVDEGLIEPIDVSRLPNYDASAFDARFASPGTVNDTLYAVSKNWGTTGYAINTAKNGDVTPTTWKEFWDMTMTNFSGRTMVHDYQLTTIGNAWMSMCWTGDGKQLNTDIPEIKYVLGKEGGELWSDFYAIPKGAPHMDAAYALIDFLLTPENNAKEALFHGYPVADARTNALLPAELLNDPIIYPAADLLSALEFGAAATLTDPNRAELLARFKSA